MEGRSFWIQDGDVDGPLDEGTVVTAARPLSDWCLRGDDNSEPVPAGTLIEVVEKRPWGAAMAQELPAARPGPRRDGGGDATAAVPGTGQRGARPDSEAWLCGGADMARRQPVGVADPRRGARDGGDHADAVVRGAQRGAVRGGSTTGAVDPRGDGADAAGRPAAAGRGAGGSGGVSGASNTGVADLQAVHAPGAEAAPRVEVWQCPSRACRCAPAPGTGRRCPSPAPGADPAPPTAPQADGWWDAVPLDAK